MRVTVGLWWRGLVLAGVSEEVSGDGDGGGWSR